MVKLSKSRKAFIHQVVTSSVRNIKGLTGNQLQALKEGLEVTLFRERMRIKQNSWAVDPEDEEEFWAEVKASLLAMDADQQLDDQKRKPGIMKC